MFFRKSVRGEELLEFLSHIAWYTGLELIGMARQKGRRISRSTVHVDLAELEDQGLVQRRPRGERCPFRIRQVEYLLTENGIKRRRELAEAKKPVWSPIRILIPTTS